MVQQNYFQMYLTKFLDIREFLQYRLSDMINGIAITRYYQNRFFRVK